MIEQETINLQMQDIINRDPDSYVTLQIPLFNADKGTTNSTSAYDIFKQIEVQMGDQVQIMKVEFAQKDYQSGPFKHEPEYNNFTDVPFIIHLFGLKENPNLLISTEEEYQGDESQEDENDQKGNQQYTSVKQILDAIFELHFEKIQPQVFKELLAQSNQKPQGRLQVTLRMKVRHIKKYHEIQVKLFMGQNLPPLFLKTGEGREVKKYDQIIKRQQDKKINLQSITLGMLHHKENQEDIQVYQYQEYFNFQKLGSFLENNFVSQYMFFIDDQDEPPYLEILIDFGSIFILKIQINLIYVQFGIFEEYQMYLKLLTPPQFYVSLMTKEKYEKPQFKKDWIRIDNFILNQLFSKNLISDILRLILINNTTINIKLTEKKELIIQVMQKLKNAYSVFNQNNKLQIKSVEPKLDDIDEQTYVKQFKSLKFDIAYNILTTVSLNQLNRFNEIQLLIKQIIKDLTKSQDKKQLIKIIHQAFFVYNQICPNLNKYTDQISYNKAAFDRFRKILKQTQQETIPNNYINLQLIYMRKVSLTPSGFLYFPKIPEETSAIVRLRINQIESFIRVHFEDENQDKSNKIPYVTDMFYKHKVMPIKIFDRNYILFTWSSSQLRSGSCWFFDPTSSRMTRRQLIESIGDFSNLQYEQVAKNAARLGQNLSSSKTVKLPNLPKVIISNDLKDENGMLYTDGIGKISRDFIEYIKSHYHDNSIRAVQVRFEGAKGVLTLNQKLPESTIELRKSMVKYNPVQNSYKSGIEILDYNKFRGGYLNRQIIILLKTLGVEDQVFQELQNEYLFKMQDISLIDSSIYNYFSADYDIAQSDLNIINILRDLMNAGLNQNNNILIDGIINRLRRRGLMILRTKTNILVEQAARVLGIVDEFNILKAGEIYLCVSKTNRLLDAVNISGRILVTRNPCLHPGDIRVLDGVTNQTMYERAEYNPYEEFTNCIVFPQEGPSIPPQIAGGDLDGDIYFVSWNQKLIPPNIQDPMKYDQPVGKQRDVKFKERNEMYHANDHENFFPIDKMVDFLFNYINSDVLGKIDNSHLAIADKSPKMANDETCLILSELHSKAVDFVKHGEQVYLDVTLIAKEWPDYMEKTKNTYTSQTVIGKLYRQVVDLCKSEQDKLPPWLKGFNVQALPKIQSRFIKGFDEINFQGENHIIQEDQLNEADINQEQSIIIQQWIQKRLRYFEAAIIIIQFIFQQMKALMYLYDIKHEYEIYSGNFTNLTKGDGLYRKTKINVDNIQKRIICALISLRNQSHQKVESYALQLADNQENLENYTQEIISAIHLILSYSPESHRYNLKSNLGCLLYTLFQRLRENGNFKSLIERFVLWYRGASWYFFHQEILNIELKEQIEELI